MWLLEFLYFVMTLLLGWILFGYFVLIWFMGRFHNKEEVRFPTVWPRISLLIPCFNEEEQILEKLKDIRSLDYPKESLEIVFADGGSSDGTVKLLESTFGHEGQDVRLVRCPCRGKINQLNHVLPRLTGEIIVNTDADARLSSDLLKWVAAEFAKSSDIGVVGAYCCPEQPLEIDDYYWSAQNKGRLLETDAGVCSIVIAQCYAFRRELLRAFPDDVVADDVYVAFLSNTLGLRTIYSRHAIALETRNPDSYENFLPHKFRKSNAFLRESLRFLYRLPEMSPRCKMMFLTRISQQLLLPYVLIFWIQLAVALIALLQFDVLAIGTMFIALLFFVASRVFSYVELPDRPHRFSILTMLKGFTLTCLIMFATGISYPFFRQDSSYTRLRHNGKLQG